MRVQYRLLILSGLLGIIFLAGLFILKQTQISNAALIIEGQRSKLDKLFNQLVEIEGQSMEVLAYDYTFWDEFVDFVKTGNPDFAANILDQSLEGYNVDAIWVFNPDFQLVYFTCSGCRQEEYSFPLTTALLSSAFGGTPFAHFYYKNANGEVIEIRAATIHPSDDVSHQTPGQGYMFVGCIWKDQRLTTLSELTDSQIGIVDATTLPPPSSNPMDDILIYHPLPGLDGQPVAYIEGRFTNQYATGFNQAKQRDLIYYAGFAAVLSVVLLFGLTRWVTQPVNNISNSLTNETTAPLKKLLTEHSEFGHIARMIQTSFDQRELMGAVIHRHEKTEQALRESEERYRIVTELASDAAYALRIDASLKTHLEWGAEAITRLTGYSFEQLNSLETLQSIVYPDDWSILTSQYEPILAGKPVTLEFRIVHKNGEIHWLRNHLFPVVDPQSEKVARLYGAAQEINAEKVAQEAYHALVDNSPFGLAIYQDGMIAFSNLALMRITGFSGQEILEFTPGQIFSYIHPGDRVGLEAVIERAIHLESELESREMRLRFKDGIWHWVNISAVHIEYQGKPALQITFNDISDRKQAEQALDQQQQYSSAILNTVDALVMILDAQGQIISCNPAGLHLLRLESQDLFEKSLWDIVNIPDDNPIAPEYFATLINTRTPVRDVDLFVRHPEGRAWLSWSQTYLIDGDGKVGAVVGTAIDISERKIRERQRESIATIANAVRTNITRREIAEITLKAFNDFLQVESVAVGFPDPSVQHILLEFVTGTIKDRLDGQKLPMENSISGDVFRTGKPYLTNDLKNEKHFYTKDLLETLNAAAWVPMVMDGAVIGIVIVSSSRPIEQAEFNALIPIADMAASAIHRAKLADQMQQRLQQLTALRAINISIGASFDLHVTFNVLVNQIHTQLSVDAVCVLLVEPNTSLLRYAAGNGFRSPAIEQLSYWFGEGPAGRIALERHSQHIYDPGGLASYFNHREWLVGEDFVAYHAVPMVVKGEIKGVLETFHRAPYAPQPDFQQLLEALAMETAIAIDKTELLNKLQVSNQDLIIAYDKTIEGWARALELRDEETEGHTRRVAEYTMRLGQAYGITGAQLMHIRRGALLHDMGKIGIPDRILLKPTDLTPDEWKIMRTHPVLAHEMLSSIEFLRPALDIPYCHHEHWDGSGYPRGLTGEEIPVAARLFSVIDVWDALRHKRPYREAWSEERVIAHLKELAGRTLDPEIVRIFLEIRPLIVRQGR